TGKLLDAVTCALYKAVNDVSTHTNLLGRFNMGLMAYGESNNQGGRWIFPYAAAGSGPTSLTLMDSTGIGNFKSTISGFNQLASNFPNSNSRSAPGVFQEAWAFYTGNIGLSGANYSNHITASCQRSYIIFIGAAAKQGAPTQSNSCSASSNACLDYATGTYN